MEANVFTQTPLTLCCLKKTRKGLGLLKHAIWECVTNCNFVEKFIAYNHKYRQNWYTCTYKYDIDFLYMNIIKMYINARAQYFMVAHNILYCNTYLDVTLSRKRIGIASVAQRVS